MAGLPPSEWTPVKETANSGGKDDVPSNVVPVDPIELEEPVFVPPSEACPFQNAPSFAQTQPSVVTVQPSFAPQPTNQYYQQPPHPNSVQATNQYVQPQAQPQPQAQQTPSQQMTFAPRPATMSQTQPPKNFQPTVVASMAQAQTTSGPPPPPNRNPFFYAAPPQQFRAMPAGNASNWICSICGMNNTGEVEYCGNCQKVKTPLAVPPASMQQQMVMMQLPNGETVMMAAPQQEQAMMAIGPDGQMIPMFPPAPPRQQLRLTFDSSPMTCPHCSHNGRTKITRKPGLLSFISGGVLCVGGCFFIAWVPFFLPPCQDIQHTCPNCHKLLGVRKRVG